MNDAAKGPIKRFTGAVFDGKCVLAWNAYRGGTLTKLKFQKAGPLPKLK